MPRQRRDAIPVRPQSAPQPGANARRLAGFPGAGFPNGVSGIGERTLQPLPPRSKPEPERRRRVRRNSRASRRFRAQATIPTRSRAGPARGASREFERAAGGSRTAKSPEGARSKRTPATGRIPRRPPRPIPPRDIAPEPPRTPTRDRLPGRPAPFSSNFGPI